MAWFERRGHNIDEQTNMDNEKKCNNNGRNNGQYYTMMNEKTMNEKKYSAKERRMA